MTSRRPEEKIAAYEGLAKQPLANVHAVFSTKIFHDFGQGVSNVVADSIGTKRVNIKGMGLPGWTGAIISFTGAAAGVVVKSYWPRVCSYSFTWKTSL
tara:strand:- start:2195 stop:2488 length:294 start_codon:yes stop_codon:yes gene_type:complete